MRCACFGERSDMYIGGHCRFAPLDEATKISVASLFELIV